MIINLPVSMGPMTFPKIHRAGARGWSDPVRENSLRCCAVFRLAIPPVKVIRWYTWKIPRTFSAKARGSYTPLGVMARRPERSGFYSAVVSATVAVSQTDRFSPVIPGVFPR